MKRRARLLLLSGSLLIGLALGAVAPHGARAFIFTVVSPNFPLVVTVGDTGLPGSLTVANNSTPPESLTPLPFFSITLTPSCGLASSPSGPECDGAGGIYADPGVFSLSGTAVGSATPPGNLTCEGVWTVTLTNVSTGTYTLTPPAGPGTLVLSAGTQCTVNFTLSVLQAPTKDANPVLAGLQTAQIGFARGITVGGFPLFSARGGRETTVATMNAVTFRSLTVNSVARGALVRWVTASEHRTLGFNVYGLLSGKRAKVNRRLIAAKGSSGASYSFSYRTPRGKKPPARFWLQVVNLDGSRTWYGAARLSRT